MTSTPTRASRREKGHVHVPLARGYALDSSWYAERDRLDSLTGIYDPATMRLLKGLGLAPGWRCLEVGAGTGSIARFLAASTGPTGSVLAIDLDTRFLDHLADATLRVEEVDVVATPPAVAAYDLVHARLLLEHLAQREAVLASLTAALRPGGWLLVEDLDWATAEVVDPPSTTHSRLVRACLQFFTAHDYDPYYGRTLPSALAAAGLTRIGVRSQSVTVRSDPAGGLPQWELLVEQLTPALLAGRLIDQGDIDTFHALWHDGRTVCFAPLMVSAWGRRPQPAW